MATITIDRSVNADDAFAMSGGIAFVALASGSSAYQNQPTGITTWSTATISATTAWQSVCYGNNIVVAVSSTSGTIAATSPTGVSGTWTARTMPATASWYAVRYGLDKFVAVSSGASTAGAYSTDGAKWTSTGALTTSGNWRCLEFGGDRFVTISYNSTDSNYSTDGTTWNAGGALPSRNWISIAYGNGTFVAIAAGTSDCAYSTDGGVTWNTASMSASSAWISVTYGNGKFVAVSSTSGTIAAYSTDGITWNASTLPNTRTWAAVAFGNNLFTALAASSTTGAAFSYDGINWSGGSIATVSQAVTCMCHTPTTWNSNDTLVITNNSTVTVNTDQSKFWNAITLTNGKLAITNTSTSTGIRFTMGRVTGATAASITPGSGIGDIEINGNWIELGTGDGTSGQTMTAPFSDYIPALWVETGSGTGVYEQWLNATGSYGDASSILLEGLAAVGSGKRGKFFIQTANAAPYGPTILNGTDGSIAQRLITVTSTTGLYAGASIQGPGIPASAVINRIVSSTMVETNAVSTTELSPNWKAVAFGNSTYVAISDTASNIAATSSDGITWTKRTLPFVANWNGICYGATSALFVAVCSDITTTGGTQIGSRFCATSADGITWTRRAMPANQSWNAVATDGTKFVAVGGDATNAATTGAASSTDGLTWVAATMATSQIWNAVGFGGGRFVAVGTGTASNYDADGAGTWTNGATLTSATYMALTYNGTIWMAISGSTTGNQNKADPTSGAFTAGGALPNSTSRGVAWDGTNFVVVSTTNSTQTARSTNGAAWTTTTLTGTQIGSWNAIVANGTTLVAVSSSGNLRSYAMTSTDSGATWTVRTGMVTDVSLTCYNPYVSQLTNTVQFGDNINGNKVPNSAKVRCPNIMFTSAVPVNIQTASSIVGANMVMTAAGSLTANICLFDESYNTFNQAEILSLTNCGFAIPPIINECYNVTFNSVGFALPSVRRYYTYSATIGADGWFTRDNRYADTFTWSYINGASITDFNVCVGSPKALVATASSVTSPSAILVLSYTEDSTWSYVRFYALNCVASFLDAFNFTANFNNNSMEHLEFYGVAPILLQTSSGNTFTDIRIAEDMFNAYRSFPTTLARIGNDPNASARLLDDTKYYLKSRTFYDWNDRTNFAEGRTVSSTPFIGSQFFPAYFGAYNNATRVVTLTWIRRDPTSSGAAGTTTYQIFRDTTPGFTPDVTNRIFDTLTVATVSYLNGFIATITATASPARTITFAAAGRTITLGGAGAGSFITAGYVIGGNVVVAGTVSNNGTYTILSFTATVITLTTNHTNLVNETAPNGATLDGVPPVNGTSYYYKLRKYDALLSGITSASGTVALTSLTTAGNFNTGLGSIINLQGISGQFKIRIPVGSTTNFFAGNVFPGLTLAGTGIGSGAKVVSLDTAWQITVDVANTSTFTGTTATLGLATGAAPNNNIYVVGPGIARPTRVSSVTNSTTIVVDTAFIATFAAQAIFFEYGTDSSEVEVTPSGPTIAAFNFLTQSNDFTHANWVKTNLTATANAVSGPNDPGFTTTAAPTADRLVSTGPTAKAVQTITSYLEIGASYTFSVYIRTDAHHYAQTVTGELSVNTTVTTTEAFTATGVWQRIQADFTATAVTHTFTIQMTTEGSYIYASNAQVNQGTTALVPVTTTTVKTAVASGGRTFTFASAIDGVNTITASSGDFTTAPAFAIGDSIIVQSTSDNDGTYVLSAVTATVLTVVPAQPLVSGGGAQTTGSIVGSVLAAAAQEFSGAYAWGRATGGNTANQGIEVALAALPTGSFWTELYVGTTSGFSPSSVNRVGYTLNMLGASTTFYLLNSNNNVFDTLVQEGVGGFSGTRAFLRGSSNNKFLDWTLDYNYGSVPVIGDVANLSNNNVFDDFTVKNFRNYSTSPFISINDSSGLTLQNITLEQAHDIPYSLQSLNTVVKGVTGANAASATTATTYFFGAGASTLDGMAVAYQAVYDNIFYELYHSETTGALHMLFNASSSDTPPYTTVAGTPTFGNNGRLYLRTAGDSIEYTWPHRIYTVSSFRDVILKKNGLDLGSSLDELQSLLIEFKVDTGAGYGAYQTATPANLAATAVDTTNGFLLKIRITARPGMLFSTQTNAFVVGEEIEGTTSGATATVDEVFNLTTTSGCIVLSSVVGSFIPTELIRRNSDNQTRATNVVTNTQFALFPSFNSYIDGLQIFTNTVGPGDYPGRVVDIVLTNVVSGSTYYVFKTADSTLVGSGTASGSTVTLTNVAYVTDFGITVRVRKASAATKYIPLETQATVTSTGASVYIGQLEDTIVGASVSGTIAGDFTVNTTTKTIKHTADTVVYTANELYTWLMDYFDDVTTIDDTVPISAQTPTEYTLTNGWFMDNESFKYLSGGAIQTDGQDAYNVHVITVTGGTYADPVSGDITKTVMAGATSIGPLLDYEVISAGVSAKWYVRDNRVTPAQIASATAMTITTGTGSGNNSVNSVSGEHIWANVFSLGTIVSGTTLDVYQNDSQITPWWSAGQIDILVKVKEAGTEIDSGNLTVLARKYATLYDHYVVDASTGRNPVPLAAFADTNNEELEATVGAYAGITFDFGAASKDLGNGNGAQPYDCVIDAGGNTIQEVYEYLKYVTRTGSGTTLNGVNGEYYQAVGDIRLAYTGEASGPFVEGTAITSSAGGTGYIVSLIDNGATGTLVIRNVHGTFADTNTLTSGGTTATINGTPTTILQSKQSPFGTFSGGKLFGARGVWIENVDVADSINYQLIDSLGVDQSPPISVAVTVKDANSLAAVESARVLLEAAAGGDLPSAASVTITRSGATATVTHASHGMTTGMTVIIRGAAEDEYNGIFTISNVSGGAYDYTVTGTPATPATGTITATCAILNGATNVSGVLQTATFNYTSDQPVGGKVRRATTGVKYKTGAITGTITSTGLNTTVLLILDE